MIDLASMSYGELVDSLRKDLQLDLSTDAIQHTGNDVPVWANVPASWYGSNWQALASYTPQYTEDANGWITLRGLAAPKAAYGYGTVAAAVLVIPAAKCPKSAHHMFQQLGQDSVSNEFIARTDFGPVNGNGVPGGFAQCIFLQSGVGTNNGNPGYINLCGIRWNYRTS